MNRAQWTARTDAGEAYRRATGRRRYNQQRRERAQARRQGIRAILERGILHPREHGLLAALGRHFGVHRSTVYRDMAALAVSAGERWEWYPDTPCDPAAVREMLAQLNHQQAIC